MPKNKKEFWRPEALALRRQFIIMLPFEVFLLIYCDIYIYTFYILSIIFDSLLIWLCFFNYMTLNKFFCIGHVFIIFMQPLMAISRVQDILISSHSWTYTLCFLAQFFIVYPLFLFFTGKALKDHMVQQKEFREEQEMK